MSIPHNAEKHVPYVILVDAIVHTTSRPFCQDVTCPCHEENQDAIATVAQAIADGLLTPDEATRLVAGKQV
ncbi:MAG TPA: hypothetical protein VJ761_12945 [Ktedonobacteraceae bacterium]|nr:hypothetical protein [Ktedonobacteraceae bacterium]